MKTILHLIDTTGPGGAETVFIQLADQLRKRDYKSIVVIRGEGWVQQELLRRGLVPIILPSKGSFAVGFLWKLLKLIRKEKVVLIQSHLLGSNVYAAIAGLIAGIPVVATYHGMVDVNPQERFKAVKHKAMQWGITRYVAVSKRLMRNIEEQNLLDVAKSRVIYNGVDMSVYGPVTASDVRSSLSLHDKAILIGSLGNIRPAKSYDVLIKAGAEVLKTEPNAHFVIAGDRKPSLMKELNALMEELGVSDNFHFIGFCSDCATFLGQMDAFVLSSSSEGFSIATIEAMATGLPVVVTRCGGPEEILSQDGLGVMVAPRDPLALAQGVKSIINDKELATKVARAGQQHAHASFSLSGMLDSYDEIYRELSP